MNKILQLSRIKGLIFVLKSLTEYNIDFIYHKKSKRTNFLLYIQNICLNGFKSVICFKNYQTYHFLCSQESKFFVVRKIFLDQGIFPRSRKFFTNRNVFRNNVFCLWTFLVKSFFSLIKKIFHKQGIFPPAKLFP